MFFISLIIVQYFPEYAYPVQQMTNTGFRKACGNGHFRLNIPYGALYTGTDIRSLLECTARCSHLTECLSLNFCHLVSGKSCEMYDRSLYSTGLNCQDLTTANDCIFMEKVHCLIFTIYMTFSIFVRTNDIRTKKTEYN